jgi:uncharacterized protein YkwD
MLAVLIASTLAVTPFESRLLAVHNVERLRMRQAPLVWDTALAKDAAVWARTLAASRRFEHAPQSKQGENLWMGTRGAYSLEAMVGYWIDERALFKRGRFPDVSRTGKWADVGHYTQAIWYNTTHVGCAIAANNDDEILVCRYSPPGNWMGSDPLGPQ